MPAGGGAHVTGAAEGASGLDRPTQDPRSWEENTQVPRVRQRRQSLC